MDIADVYQASEAMKTFDILDPTLPIHQHYLLEASAGTGKTYSIENLVVRLLIERDVNTGSDPYTIERILVMTFTRAAARELKARIRLSIFSAISKINGWLENFHAPFSSTNHYLDNIRLQGEIALKTAKRNLEQALFSYDQAYISTIHGFCQRMLKEELFAADWLGREDDCESTLSRELIQRFLRDYVRTELHTDLVSSGQLQLLDRNFEQTEKVLIELIQKGPIKCPLYSFKELFEKFQSEMKKLSALNDWDSEKICADFALQSERFNNSKGYRKDYNEAEMVELVAAFVRLLNAHEWDQSDFDALVVNGLTYVQALNPEHAKKNKNFPPLKLHYPSLYEVLQPLNQIVEQARNKALIYANLAHYTQQHISKIIDQEELYSHDTLLQRMQKAVHELPFAEQVRQRFDAVVIDEFQDTDPIQWDIFKTLFLDSQAAKVYLVGDPKQSIYSFRQADIYTYLKAAEAIGEGAKASLQTNFRSQATLVEGLNALFDPKNVPGCISLPRLSTSLDCPAVKASNKIEPFLAEDGLGDIHFGIVENAKKETQENCLFPFIVREINKLKKSKGISYSQWAILIRDRNQGKQLSEYLQKMDIPFTLLKDRSLTESKAFSALIAILNAAIEPQDTNRIKAALGSRMMGWDHLHMQTLTEEKEAEKISANFKKLHHILYEQGFELFFEALLHSSWHKDESTLAERILLQVGGLDYYRELNQIAEAITEFENEEDATPAQLLAYICQLTEKDGEDDALKIKSDPHQDSVKLLTIHSSKGLEFDFVCALGLIQKERSRIDWVFPHYDSGKCEYEAVLDEHSANYRLYREEVHAEKMRQLYVALTRAKYRLYVPLVEQGEIKDDYSPIELYLSYFKNGLKGLCQVIDDNCLSLKLSYEYLSQDQPEKENLSLLDLEQNRPTLIPPSKIELPCKRTFIHSFSSLVRESSGNELKESPPHDYFNADKSIHTLPAGSDTGLIFHTLVETVPINLVKDAKSAYDLRDFVAPVLQRTAFSEWLDVFCEGVYHAWKATLKAADHQFSLCDIDPDLLFREIEFLFPNGILSLNLPVQSQDLLKGVIDLVFQYKGRYYLVDWKTNWLGSSSADYQIDRLQQAMQSHQYHIQAAIYKEALKRYIQIFDKRPFDEVFGGCFYLFLRGLNLSGTTGILQLTHPIV